MNSTFQVAKTRPHLLWWGHIPLVMMSHKLLSQPHRPIPLTSSEHHNCRGTFTKTTRHSVSTVTVTVILYRLCIYGLYGAIQMLLLLLLHHMLDGQHKPWRSKSFLLLIQNFPLQNPEAEQQRAAMPSGWQKFPRRVGWSRSV